ncbi:MAG: tRNA (adenosine(37)-N6)-threonylcarbamoyltransferase complex transferase subunit TsaD [Thermodesulfobacteriota bacterium]
MASITLGIESSCDETAASVIRDGREVLSSVVASQIDIHKEFGGVVPELASRKHVELIIPVIQQSIANAGVKLEQIEGVCVTCGPGLMGCLLVGMSAAKAIAYSLDVPFIGVDHLEAHIAAAHIEHDVPFPFVGLITSGGHTSLYLVNDYTDYILLGKTRDDAAGEALDKAGKLLGLSYPGGVEIDKASKSGDRLAIEFPRPFMSTSSHDFSFSGVKTALVYFMRENGGISDSMLNDICASYQEAVVETLVEKTLYAAKTRGVEAAVISGGVACNTRLREMGEARFAEHGIRLHVPSPEYCTDNAAMIGVLGYHKLKAGDRSGTHLKAYSTTRPRYIRGRGLIEE